MLVPYNSQFVDWKYVEVASFIPGVNAVIRKKDKGEIVFCEWGDEVQEYANSLGRSGVYTSVLRFRDKDLDSSRLGSLYFDFDDENNPDAALRDARILYSHFSAFIDSQHIRTYFTGAKGFHIEIEPIPLGISPTKDLVVFYRSIASNLSQGLGLNTLDMAVYDNRRMWRLPNTKNQKTGLYKIELEEELFLNSRIEAMRELAITTQPRLTPSHLDLNHTANTWYKEQLAEYEEALRAAKEEIARRKASVFNMYGTDLAKKTSRRKMHRTLEKAVVQVLNSEAGKNRNNTLSQAGYTVFLTALEGDYDPEDFQEQLMEAALAIGLQERESKATLRSALRAANNKHESSPRKLAERI